MPPSSPKHAINVDKLIERTLDRLYWRGWPARLAYTIGLQPLSKVVTLAINTPDPHPARPPLRLVFASDFHAGPTTHPVVLAHAGTLLQELQPDLLLLGGDFVSFRAEYLRDILPFLGMVKPRFGSYAVLGNHDYWAEPQQISAQLQQAGVTLLTNRNLRLPAPYDDLWLCGIDDPQAGTPDPEASFAGSGPHRIVLMHSPDTMRLIRQQPFMLGLAGHTHGGQICLPGNRPLLLPPGPACRDYPGGLYHPSPEQAALWVSRGIGCSGAPFRLNAPPDLLLCTIA